jgi:large subunit ribosomal protein L1
MLLKLFKIKAGKIDFKVKLVLYMLELVVSLELSNPYDNAHEIIQTLIKLKPTAAKGTYIKGTHYKHYESLHCIDQYNW